MRHALVAVLCIGCSSHYMPRSTGRIAVTMQNGQQVYVRDGKTYEHGVLGSGLADVVAGNPAAEHAAREYHDRIRDGILEAAGGGLVMIAGAGFTAYEGATGHNDFNRLGPPIGLAIAGIVLMYVGLGTAITAEPYRWDAINLFNDGAGLPPPTFQPPGFVSSAPPPKASLRMGD